MKSIYEVLLSEANGTIHISSDMIAYARPEMEDVVTSWFDMDKLTKDTKRLTARDLKEPRKIVQKRFSQEAFSLDQLRNAFFETEGDSEEFNALMMSVFGQYIDKKSDYAKQKYRFYRNRLVPGPKSRGYISNILIGPEGYSVGNPSDFDKMTKFIDIYDYNFWKAGITGEKE